MKWDLYSYIKKSINPILETIILYEGNVKLNILFWNKLLLL